MDNDLIEKKDPEHYPGDHDSYRTHHTVDYLEESSNELNPQWDEVSTNYEMGTDFVTDNECEDCQSEGLVECPNCRGNGCKLCKGLGDIICPTCKGRGHLK